MRSGFPGIFNQFIPWKRSPAKEPVRIPIRAKVTLPYLLVALVLFLGMGYVVYRVLSDTKEERYTNQLIEAGKLSSEWMVREENHRLETLRLLAQTEGVAQALQAHNAEALRELSFGITVDKMEEEVQFLDAHGSPVLSMRHKPGGLLEEYSFSAQGAPPSPPWPFVQQVLQQQSDSVGDKYAGVAGSGDQRSFYIAGPIFTGDGQFAGVVLVGKTLATLVSQMRQATLAQVSLYDLNGQVLATTHLDPPDPLTRQQAVELVQVKADQSLKRDPSSTRALTSASIGYSEILSPWMARGSELGLLGTAMPRSMQLFNASRFTIAQTITLGPILILLVILLGLNIANLITPPILRLMHASTEVARGNLSVQVPPTSNDEVGVLTNTFNQMVTNLQQSKHDLVSAYDETLKGWSKSLELRDQETEGHSERVTELTVRLATRMGFNAEQLVHIRRGAMLHDHGKMGVPDAILRKPGPLTDEEWLIMRKHPQFVMEMLGPIEYLRPALVIPRCHHEKWDGSGYPAGLKGEEIPLEARIFAVIDVWDAMRSDRYYRKALSEEVVIAHIQKSSGSHFDPAVVEAFVQMQAESKTPAAQPKWTTSNAPESIRAAAPASAD